MKIQEMLKNRKICFLLILFLNATFFVLAAWLLPFRFEENDDVTMCMIANGVFSGTPDCHLVFINAIYGSLLVLLYRICGVIEWYTISFAILHVLSMSVIVHYVHFGDGKRLIKAIFLLVFYSLWIRIILSLQFTTTAGVTCLAGCILLSRHTKKDVCAWLCISAFGIND